MRLPIQLRDDSGTVHVTLWHSEFGGLITKNIDELGQMYAECDGGDRPKQAFLEALNTNASTNYLWTLRSKLWVKSATTDPVLQWQVVKVVCLA